MTSGAADHEASQTGTVVVVEVVVVGAAVVVVGGVVVVEEVAGDAVDVGCGDDSSAELEAALDRIEELEAAQQDDAETPSTQPAAATATERHIKKRFIATT